MTPKYKAIMIVGGAKTQGGLQDKSSIVYENYARLKTDHGPIIGPIMAEFCKFYHQ